LIQGDLLALPLASGAADLIVCGLAIGHVPALDRASPTQIAEAVRQGPFLMPRSSAKAITERQLADLVAYVQYAKHPNDRGGWALGHLGPWPEGMVTWLLAAGVLVAVCTMFARRVRS